MFRNRVVSTAALLCSSLAMFTSSVKAGLITAGPYTATGASGNGTASVINLPPSFNIDSAAKRFTMVGMLDFDFPVSDNGATTVYLVTEGVTNNTTQTWTDYHEQLGTGVDGQFTLGNLVTFVTPPDASYTNTAFSTLAVTSSEIDYTGGAVVPGAAITLTFSIDVPDIIGTPAGTYDFTLRQFPTVPEPSTLGLLAIGSISLLNRRRRKH